MKSIQKERSKVIMREKTQDWLQNRDQKRSYSISKRETADASDEGGV